LTVTDCFVPGPWIVFFDENSVKLRDDAKLTLDRLMEKWRDSHCGGFALAIKGHTDIHERAIVAGRRAKAVRTYLLGAGMTSRNMKLKDVGSQEPRVENHRDRAEPQNRRVYLHAESGE
jgi:outer membrane protein OmpA-like peptidoglycan-associated protein